MEVETIYIRFNAALLAYIKSKVCSREDAEDILQNVFIKISTHINSLHDTKKLTSWVYKIARNSIIDYYRTNKTGRSNTLDNLEDIEEETANDHSKGLDQCISGMISLLPDDYKAIIIDSEMNGIKQKDLGQKYNIPYSTVRSKVQRGRERLKEMLINCCHIEVNKHGNILDVNQNKACGDACNYCSE